MLAHNHSEQEQLASPSRDGTYDWLIPLFTPVSTGKAGVVVYFHFVINIMMLLAVIPAKEFQLWLFF